MDRRKARFEDGRVFDIRDLREDIRFIHPDYRYIKGNGTLSDTGELVLFKLIPKSLTSSTFVARWDGGSRGFLHKTRYDVDVDMDGPGKAEEKQFRNGKNGYSGHHTTKISDAENKYRVCISTPSGQVFDANISFSKHHRLTLSARNGLIASLTRHLRSIAT